MVDTFDLRSVLEMDPRCACGPRYAPDVYRWPLPTRLTISEAGDAPTGAPYRVPFPVGKGPMTPGICYVAAAMYSCSRESGMAAEEVAG